MANAQDYAATGALRRGSNSSAMDRWASFVRPFAPRDPCDHCGRGSCEVIHQDRRRNRVSRGRRSVRDGDLYTASPFTTGEQLQAPTGVMTYDQLDAQRNEIEGNSFPDKKLSADEQSLSFSQGNDSTHSLPQSYLATPDGYEDSYEDSTENIIGLARSTPPKRHTSHQQPVSRRRSLVERLRVYSADWAPKPGLKRESLRLSPLPSLPYSGYIHQQSLEDQAHTAHRSQGSAVGSFDGFVFPKPPSTPVHLPDSRPPPPSDLVTWNGRWDPEDPLNRPTSQKVTSTAIILAMGFCAAFASSTLAAARSSAALMFETDEEVVITASALTVFGIGVGAPLWASLADLYGRKGVLTAAFVVFIVFNIPVGLAKDIETLLAFRFFLGVFGAAPLAIAPLCITDVWRPAARGTAVSFFSAVCIIGSVMGTVASGCLTVDADLGWRWTALIAVGLSLLFATLAAFFYQESCGHVLLRRKARILRLMTNDWALHTEADEYDLRARHCVLYSIRMFTQPAFLLPTMHMSLAYGVLYLLFVPYENSFHSERGWSLVLDLLTLLPVAFGALIGVFINWIISKKKFPSTSRTCESPSPEARLIPMIIGAWALPIGLLVFGWTSAPTIFFVPEIMAGVPTGVGISLITIGGFNYLIDTYETSASSAIGANILLRSLFAGAFQLFAQRLYESLGLKWANSTFAFVAIAFIPIPIILLKMGPRIRQAGSRDRQLGFNDKVHGETVQRR